MHGKYSMGTRNEARERERLPQRHSLSWHIIFFIYFFGCVSKCMFNVASVEPIVHTAAFAATSPSLAAVAAVAEARTHR